MCSDDPSVQHDDQLRLEQDVIAPLAASKKLYVYQSSAPWTQIKSAAWVVTQRGRRRLTRCSSAIPANSLILASYKVTNPSLLRLRSPTVAGAPLPKLSKAGPEIIEPCFIDETAKVDPSAKIGPNVSIGAGVVISFGCRVRDAIILDRTVLEVRLSSRWQC